MSGQVRARYTLEFKHEAVRLVKAGQSNSQVAKGLSLSEQTVSNWVKAEGAGKLREAVGKPVNAEARRGREACRVIKLPRATSNRGKVIPIQIKSVALVS
jgi:transposase-like protein